MKYSVVSRSVQFFFGAKGPGFFGILVPAVRYIFCFTKGYHSHQGYGADFKTFRMVQEKRSPTFFTTDSKIKILINLKNLRIWSKILKTFALFAVKLTAQKQNTIL